MNYFKLTDTTPEVLRLIKEAEARGDYSSHLDPIDYSNCYPVDDSFEYIPSGKTKRKDWCRDTFIVRPFSWMVNHFLLKTKVSGREKIKGVENAVITCNHVNKLDALVVRHAISGHRLKITVGDFNNQKGKLGDYMRAAGIMPFSTNFGALKKLNQAIAYYLKMGTYILFFPERSEWWCYEKPRPYMDGAYHYAVKNKVPVVPAFITFTMSGKFDENQIERRKFHIFLLDPIYPDPSLSEHENRQRMKDLNFEACKKKYEEFYHRPLSYEGGFGNQKE